MARVQKSRQKARRPPTRDLAPMRRQKRWVVVVTILCAVMMVAAVLVPALVALSG